LKWEAAWEAQGGAMSYVVYVVVALGWLGTLLTFGKLSERVLRAFRELGVGEEPLALGKALTAAHSSQVADQYARDS
jgi:hypothetical protein